MSTTTSTNPHKIQALIVIGLFTFMAMLDGSIVNIALPVISRELSIPFSEAAWTITSYLITLSGLLLFFGRLGDLFGKAKIFRLGMLIFTLGSLVAGLNFGLGLDFLLFGRVLQALGSAMTLANNYGIISTVFPEKERARALAIIAMFVSCGLIAGPALGGLIIQNASWDYIFLINVPIGLCAFIFGSRFLPKEQKNASWREVDVLGAILLFIAIGSFFLGLSIGTTFGWTSPTTLSSLIIGIIAFIVFLRLENRKAEPLLNLHIFDNQLFSLSVTTATLMFLAGTFSSVLLPLYLQNDRHFSSGFSGIVMLGYPIGVLIFSPIAGYLSDKFDKEIITLYGISAALLESFAFLFINQHTSGWYVLACLIGYGAALGFFKSPNNTLIMSTVEKRYLGIAGSINSLASYIGLIIGTSLSTIVLFAAMSVFSGQTVNSYVPGLSHSFILGLRVAFIVQIVVVAVAWILSFLRVIRKSSKSA